MNRTAGVVVGLVLVGTSAACGQGVSPPTTVTPGAASGTASDRMVLQVDRTGGFTATPFSRWLDFAVYADGRVYREGDSDAMAPGPMLQGLVVAQLTPAQLTDVLAEARTVIEEGESYQDDQVADAQTTRLRLWRDGAYVTQEAYPLDSAPQGPHSLRAFVDSTATLVQSLRAEPAEPASLEVWTRTFPSPPTDGSAWPGTVTWPGERLESPGPDAVPVCHVETDVTPVLAAAKRLREGQRWVNPQPEGNAAQRGYSVEILELLPGEQGCVSTGSR